MTDANALADAEQALAERDAEIARLREAISILKNRRYLNAADELERAREALGGTDADL